MSRTDSRQGVHAAGPVGIFDSGIGGLTVASEIVRQLPHEDIIYLGDTARLPYGTKSAATVRRYADRAVELLSNAAERTTLQADRVAAARALAERSGAVVVLKGTPSLVAAGGAPLAISATVVSLPATIS